MLLQLDGVLPAGLISERRLVDDKVGAATMLQPTHYADAFAGPRVMPIMDQHLERLFLGSISRARPAPASRIWP